MKRFWRIISITALLIITFAFSALADGAWVQDGRGWKWQFGDGSCLTGEWAWLDGNQDGIAECYCFGPDGYCYLNTTTPDGYQVDANGAWTVNGAVQTQRQQSLDDIGQAAQQNTAGVSNVSVQGYELAGWMNSEDGSEGTGYGYLVLHSDGTGVIRVEEDSPEYQLTWTREDDELHMNYGFSDWTAYIYDELGQIRLPIAGVVFYFSRV